MTPIRRRGLLLLCFALVCGGLAASQVRERERRVESAVGPRVPVVVARHELAAERRLRVGDLAVRRVPARFVPPDALTGAAELAGARTAVPVAAGGYLTAGMLGGGEAAGQGSAPLRPGERALEVAVAGAPASGDLGTRVDVLVTAGEDQGAGRTFVALEDVELLGLRAGGDDAEGGTPGAIATLRVSARQAVYLTAAANFAQELRLLARPPGDRRRVGAAAVGASGL